jgi:GTP-binding protein
MMLSFLAQSGLPYVIVVTKTDKLNKTERAESLAEISASPYAKGIDVIPFSSHSGEGKNDLWKLILSHTGL